MRWGDLKDRLHGLPDNHEVIFTIDGKPVAAYDPVVRRMEDGRTEVAWVPTIITEGEVGDAINAVTEGARVVEMAPEPAPVADPAPIAEQPV